MDTLIHTLPLQAFLDRQVHLQAATPLQHSGQAERVEQFFKRMFAGQAVNATEHRAATHWVHRAVSNPAAFQQAGAHTVVDGVDELQHAQHVQSRMEAFVDQVRSGAYTNPEGQPYTGILHLGIGGSDLGPRLLNDVFNRLGLHPRHQKPQGFNGPTTLRFAANVDHHELQWVLQDLDPRTTLVVVASKSFTTRETLLNAAHTLRWLDQAGPQYRHKALVGATCKPAKAIQMGVDPTRVFDFSENVGGRYSLWSPVSIAIRMVYGNAVFSQLLQGAAQTDLHVLTSPVSHNLPAQLAYSDWLNLQQGVDSLMLSPYDSRLGLLVPYLQQLWMESLGKGVDIEGNTLQARPCPMLWGDVGTNGQHAFFQLLHQGHHACAVELIGIKKPQHHELESHQILMTHFLAQAEAMSVGRFNTPQEASNPAINYKTCPGHRPVTSLLLEELTPHNLGVLLALWEHRTVALAALHRINPFDQWGVELGKNIAQGLENPLIHNQGQADNPQTQQLIDMLHHPR